eukprot:1681034-Ditylum_brightwellii.AAC.2
MIFSQKAHFVACGHTTDTPAGITYSSVISRENVRSIMVSNICPNTGLYELQEHNGGSGHLLKEECEEDGSEYYELILVYMDDCLVVLANTVAVIEKIGGIMLYPVLDILKQCM